MGDRLFRKRSNNFKYFLSNSVWTHCKIGHNGSTQISKSELEKYYLSLNKSKETTWKEKNKTRLN
jgi:phage anti-repressor protein